MACNCGSKKIRDTRVKEKTYTIPKEVFECPYCGSLKTPEEAVRLTICVDCARKVDSFVKRSNISKSKSKNRRK